MAEEAAAKSGGGAGKGLANAGAMLQLGGSFWRFGGELGSVWSRYAEAQGNYGIQMAGAGLQRIGAEAKERSAAGYAQMAGDVQRSGEEAAVNRYLQLHRDIGRIYAGAAGGGIEVSSRVVSAADRTARQMANRDVTAINRTYAAQANQHLDQASQVRLAAAADRANARMAEVQARYGRDIARSNRTLGMWSAAGNLMGSLGSLALGYGMAMR